MRRIRPGAGAAHEYTARPPAGQTEGRQTGDNAVHLNRLA
jgi:hypothetical protein